MVATGNGELGYMVALTCPAEPIFSKLGTMVDLGGKRGTTRLVKIRPGTSRAIWVLNYKVRFPEILGEFINSNTGTV